MAIARMSRGVNSLCQNGPRFDSAALLGQGLSLLKVGGDILGMPVDHFLELAQADFEVPFADAGLRQRVL